MFRRAFFPAISAKGNAPLLLGSANRAARKDELSASWYEADTRVTQVVWLTSCMTAKQANALASQLNLEMHTVGICLACLTFVAFPLDSGDERELKRALRYFTPVLWEEGLAAPARDALANAAVAGTTHAKAALDDVDRRGSRAPIVRAIVLRLASQMVEEMHRDAATLSNGSRRIVAEY